MNMPIAVFLWFLIAADTANQLFVNLDTANCDNSNVCFLFALMNTGVANCLRMTKQQNL
jgi:hypothetical protein